MADHMPAQIWIGGKLPRRLLAEFPVEGLAFDWGGPPIHDVTEEGLLKARDEQGLLTFCDEEARWGEFAELEEWLIYRKLPFRRQSDGKHEYLPEIVEFRPDLGYETVCQTSCSGNGAPLLYVDDILPIVEEMEQLDGAGLSPEEELRSFRKLRERLRNRMPPEFPPLPPFEIVDD